MKDKILPVLLASALLASCSTYKSGQTPDDVYYSPAKEVSYKEEKEEEEKYEEDMTSRDDQYLKMKVRYRNKWSSIDDYDYWYDSRYNHCHCSCNHSTTSYYYYPKLPYYSNYYGGVWYNPSFPIVYYKNPKVYTGTTGKSNITSYSNPLYNNNNNSYNPKTGQPNNNNQGNQGLFRRIFSGSSVSGSSSDGFSWDRPSRTISSGSSSSSAGGRSGGTNSSGSSASGGRTRGN